MTGTTRPAITDRSVVDLFPLAITRSYLKTRVTGLCSDRSILLTADETVALAFLRKYRRLSKAASRLRRFNAYTELSYVDLVERLAAARLVRRIDGVEIERPYARWSQLLALAPC